METPLCVNNRIGGVLGASGALLTGIRLRSVESCRAALQAGEGWDDVDASALPCYAVLPDAPPSFLTDLLEAGLLPPSIVAKSLAWSCLDDLVPQPTVDVLADAWQPLSLDMGKLCWVAGVEIPVEGAPLALAWLAEAPQKCSRLRLAGATWREAWQVAQRLVSAGVNPSDHWQGLRALAESEELARGGERTGRSTV